MAMIEIDTLKEIQNIEIGILDYVVNICNENRLRYYLAGGTLLGAIRHKGFIPWDNDIDISMPRNDYNKLIEILKNIDENTYRLFVVSNDSEYYYPFAKVVDNRTLLFENNQNTPIPGMGVFIDIFPIDGFGNDIEKAKKQIAEVYEKAFFISRGGISPNWFSGFKKLKITIKKLLFVLIDREKELKKIEDMLKIPGFENSRFVGSTYGLRRENEIMDRLYYESSIDVQFNGKTYSAQSGYDYYLTQMYGDYMKLPPKDQRQPPHDIKAYWKDCNK